MQKLVVNEEELRVRMARAGVHSMAELGRKAELHYNTIYTITDTDKVFSSATVERIAAALGCSPLDLLTTISVEGPANTQRVAPLGITERTPLALVA